MIRMKVSLLTLTLVLCLMLPTMSSANQVDFVISQEGGWSDDFNDGNIEGWTVQGWNISEDPPAVLPGNFTAEDNTLRAYDEGTNQAYHPSTVAYGSWSFDVHCVTTPNNHSYIAFISGPATEIGGADWATTVPYEYGIVVVNGEFGGYNHTFVLYKRPQGSVIVDPLGEYEVDVISGWYNINITRSNDGDFEVYIDDTLRITATDTSFTTSDIFSFYTHAGFALDNIIVTPPEAPAGGLPVETTLLLLVGGGLAVIVIVAIAIRSRK